MGIPGDFTFASDGDVIAALTPRWQMRRLFRAPTVTSLPARCPPRLSACRTSPRTTGALVPVGFTPLSTSSDIAAGNTSAGMTTAAVFGSSRKHAKKATHKVWVVPASPNYASATADQSTANIKADVAAPARYWSKQSHGKITFKVQSIYPPPVSPNTVADLCLTSQFPALMNWAYQYAHYQGYSSRRTSTWSWCTRTAVCSVARPRTASAPTSTTPGYLVDSRHHRADGEADRSRTSSATTCPLATPTR